MNQKLKQVSQLGLISLLSIGLLLGLGWSLSVSNVQTAVAAPLANLTVTIGDSSFADDGQCSLREAIVNANQDTQAFISAGECPAGSGADTIIVGIDVTLTITDNNADGNGDNGLPVITSTIIISGDGHTLTRDGAAPPFRFFYLNQSSSILTLQNITVTNGNADTSLGGALRATTGQTMIESVTFSNNQAANGGAIYRSSNSTLKINNGRFLSNQATNGSGGAINLGCCTGGTRTILNSLFDGNSATGQGGAISVNSGGNSNVANSTFINNSAPRGGAFSITTQRPANIYNATIISNTATIEGGGIYIFTGFNNPVDLYNTLISGNYAPTNKDCSGDGRNAADARNNLFGTDGNNGGCTGFAATSANNITAMGNLDTIVQTDGNGLALLADNGGETETIALLATSQAAEGGDDSLLPNESTLGIDGDGDGNTDDPIDYDQRLYGRPYAINSDIGAFETEDVTLYARDDWYTTPETVILMITETQGVLVNDINDIAGTLTAVLSSTTTNGNLSFSATGAFTYTPTLDMCGDDSFTYYANNGIENSNTATVVINVTGCAVTAVDDTYTTTEDIPLTIAPTGVLSNDLNGFYAYLLTQPTNGNVVLAEDGGFTYTPTLDFSGVETFTYYAAGTPAAPVAYWPFDDNVNPTTDATGLGYDATINSGVTFTTEVPAALGGGMALNFDSGNGAVYSGGDSETLELQAFTAAFWVNIDAIGSYDDYLHKASVWGVEQYSTSGRVAFFTNGLSDYRLISSAAINDGQWHHVAVTYNGSTKAIYIDGALDASTSATGSINYSNDGPLQIGESGFDGRFDDVRLYRGALSQSEIQAAMAGDAPDSVDSATVTMTVTILNDAPIANDDWYEASVDQTLIVPASGVLANDVDIDNVLLTATVDTPPSVGSLTLDLDGGFTYTPQPGFTGPISYTYIASDGVLTDTATVTMTFSVDQCYTYLNSNGQEYSNPTAYAIDLALFDALDGDLIKIAGYCPTPIGSGGNGVPISITQNITLQGGYTNTNWLAASNPTLYPTTLDGRDNSRVVGIAGSTVTLDGLIVANGYITGSTAIADGGGIHIAADSAVVIENSLITHNFAFDDGGGLYVDGGSSLLIDNSQIISNTSGDEGGGMRVYSGTVTINDSAINENFGNDDGGGMQINSGTAVTITNSSVDNNISDDSGGGIETSGDLWLLNSTLNGNIGEDRGAIDGDGGGPPGIGGIVIIIANTVISGNISFINGGSVDNDSIMHISGSLIQNNVLLDDDGGGIDNDNILWITDTQIIGNYASDGCGGIYNSAAMTLTNVLVQGNQADSGGGVCNGNPPSSGGPPFSMSNPDIKDEDDEREAAAQPDLGGGGGGNSAIIVDSIISGNVVSETGGGIWNGYSRIMTLTNSIVSDNMVISGGVPLAFDTLGGGGITPGMGGGIWNGYGSWLTLKNTTVSNNSTYQDGGGVYNMFGTLTVSNSAILSNTAVSGGGIAVVESDITLYNSTVSGNTADENGAIMQDGGSSSTMIGFSTIAGNTAVISGTGIGVYTGTMSIAHSIIAGNGIPNCTAVAGTLTSTGYNLEDGDSCGLNATGDITNTNPLLQPLADNGGSTWTQAILPGSPAVDAGDPTYPVLAGDYDQRRVGYARVVNGRLDIGAYESGSFLLTVNISGTGSGTVSSTPSGIACGVDCSYPFAGVMVTLTAVSDAGVTFEGWNGGGCSGTGDCVVTMTAAQTVTATFTKAQFYIFLPVILK